jgi:hypothetical protein
MNWRLDEHEKTKTIIGKRRCHGAVVNGSIIWR